jgi:hypothetical protein
LDAWQTLLQSEDDIAPVGVLHPVAFHLKAKDDVNADLDISAAEILEVTEGPRSVETQSSDLNAYYA